MTGAFYPFVVETKNKQTKRNKNKTTIPVDRHKELLKVDYGKNTDHTKLSSHLLQNLRNTG